MRTRRMAAATTARRTELRPAGMAATPQQVLDFWFGAPPYRPRAEWFRKDAAFDEAIRTRFGTEVEAALAGMLGAAWSAGTAARLAQLLLLDQFTRNLFRGEAGAFAGDAKALRLALAMIDGGEHMALDPLQRWFVYLPLEHAEDLALQHRSVALFAEMASQARADGASLPGSVRAGDGRTPPAQDLAEVMASALDYAERHRDVVQRFGRFPHRNAALGRESTPEEVEFLKQPGSGF